MIVRVAHRPKHYTVIANQTIRDPHLTFRARGILVYLLSFTHDTRVSARGLAAVTSETRRAILAAMAELESGGYLTRERTQDSRGRWRTECVVREIPESKVARNSATLDSKVARLPRPGFSVPSSTKYLEADGAARGAHGGPCGTCGDPTAQRDAMGAWCCPDCRDDR